MRALAVIAALFAAAPAVRTQSAPIPGPRPAVAVRAPDRVLDAFQLRDATVQQILLPPSVGPAIAVEIELNGVPRTLELAIHSMYADDAYILVDDGKTLTRRPIPEVDTYRGRIAGLERSLVAAQIRSGQIRAAIYMADGAEWSVEPIRDRIPAVGVAAHVVYRKVDAKVPDDVTCGVAGELGDVPLPPRNAPNALRRCQIATDLTNSWYVRNGSNVAASVAAATNIINAVDAIYRRDVEICYAITVHIVRTRRVYSTSTNPCTLLGEMRARWRASHVGVARDVAHMFTASGSFSGVVGCAFLGVICSVGNTANGFGVSKAISNASNNRGLVAHEIGHNWSARHCNAAPPCRIMCSSLGGCAGDLTRFGPAATAQILAHKNTRTCLDNRCPGGRKDRLGKLKGVATRWVGRWTAAPSSFAARCHHSWFRLHGPICGVWLQNFDFNLATPDAYRVCLYLETTPSSNTPSAAPIWCSPTMIMNNNPVSISFPPIRLPNDSRDLFLAVVRLTQRGGNDGGFTRMTRGDLAASAVVGQVDRPGRRLGVGANNSIAAIADRIVYGRTGAGAWSASTLPWHVWIEPLVDPDTTLAGTPVARTNQRSQPGRLVDNQRDFTIAGLLSGKHPDVTDHNGTRRGDAFGFCVESSCLQPGDQVAFLVSATGFAPPFVFPGTRKGAFCLRPPLFAIQRQVIPRGRDFAKCLIRLPIRNYARANLYWQAVVIRSGRILGFTTAACQRL